MTQLTRPQLELFRATVRAVKCIGPQFLRITFGGDGLASFTCTGTAPKIKVFVPEVNRIADKWDTIPEFLEHATRRTYTVRAHRPEAHEVDIDFVIHADGPAGRWAAAAAIGNEIVLSSSAGTSPITAELALIIGDLSAAPAVMSVLETLPHSATAHIILRVDTPDDQIPLEGAASKCTTWVTAHHDATPLLQAVQHELQSFAPDYVWAAGEASSLKPVRQLLRADAGFTKSSSHVVGYWKRDATADVFEPETLARAQALTASGIELTRDEVDELSIEDGAALTT